MFSLKYIYIHKILHQKLLFRKTKVPSGSKLVWLLRWQVTAVILETASCPFVGNLYPIVQTNRIQPEKSLDKRGSIALPSFRRKGRTFPTVCSASQYPTDSHTALVSLSGQKFWPSWCFTSWMCRRHQTVVYTRSRFPIVQRQLKCQVIPPCFREFGVFVSAAADLALCRSPGPPGCCWGPRYAPLCWAEQRSLQSNPNPTWVNTCTDQITMKTKSGGRIPTAPCGLPSMNLWEANSWQPSLLSKTRNSCLEQWCVCPTGVPWATGAWEERGQFAKKAKRLWGDRELWRRSSSSTRKQT